MAQGTYAFRWTNENTEPWTEIKQPDAGLEWNWETTYQDDATRSQKGVLKATPMYTVQSIGYKASDLTLAELQAILPFVTLGKPFYFRYFCPWRPSWYSGKFYVGRGSLVIGRLNERKERIDSISFNLVSVNTVNMIPLPT